MMDPLRPYNDLKPIGDLHVEENRALFQLVEETRVAIELLNYEIKSLPSPNILVDTLALQEAKASSHIENIVTTNDDLYRGIVFDNFTAEAKEVANYKEALFAGFESLKDRGTLSVGDIERINQHVNTKQPGIRANLPGFEKSYTRIANITGGQTEILYTPPHGKELLNRHLLGMLEFVYNDDLYPIHPLVKIALAHYQFEMIHPFYDGNGRTGRILNILFLCEKGYLSYPVLYASSYIIRNKNDYYRLLRECGQNDSYTPIIEYMLLSFRRTAQKTLAVVNDIQRLLCQYTDEEFLSTLKGHEKVLKMVVEVIFRKVYVRIDDLVEIGIHRQTAASYLSQLVDKGLLQEDRVQRDKVFKNVELLKLFEGE
jgi:Fic family protein